MNYPYFFTWSKQNNPEIIEIDHAANSFLYLKDGKKVFDFSSLSGHATLGHNNTPIITAIQKQLTKLSITSPKMVYPLKERASRKLLDLINLPGKIFYTVSGAEAVENALKIAREISGKQLVMARQKSYHGASLGALSVTGDWRNQSHKTIDEWTLRIPEPDDDPDLKKTEELIKKHQVAAVIIEPISGINGVVIPPTSWWQRWNSLAQSHNFYIILDEVICGFYRTGKPFAFNHFPIQPDFICMSKGITAGYIPFGALWVNNSIAEYYNTNILACGLTNYAHPLGLVAMEVVIDQLINTKLEKKIELFFNLLTDFTQHPNIAKINILGLLAGIYLKSSKGINFNKFIDAGIYLMIKENIIMLAPPLNVTDEELTRGIDLIKKVIWPDTTY